MNAIEPPDSHHLDAAEGWAELSDFNEAARELSKIRPQFRNHPDVLTVRWVLAIHACQWLQALSLARDIKKLTPDKPNGWTYEANSLVELQRPAEAYSTLFKAWRRFPRDEIIAYDLGCVCCILERAVEALRWVRHAIDLGGIQTERRAMADPALRPVWNELCNNRQSLQPDIRPYHAS